MDNFVSVLHCMTVGYDGAALKKTKCDNQKEALSPFLSALDRLGHGIVHERLRKPKSNIHSGTFPPCHLRPEVHIKMDSFFFLVCFRLKEPW